MILLSLKSSSFDKQVKEVLEHNGITIISEGADEYACLCPFHKNTDTPAMYVNKHTGLWHCFNPSCGEKGSLRSFGWEGANLKKEFTDDDIIALLGGEEVEDSSKVDDFYEQTRVEDYSNLNTLLSRGFTKETLNHFEVGYYAKKNRIIIPVRDEFFKLAGFIGRSIDPDAYLRYRYSKGFSKGKILFNLNNAKRFGSVIVVEGSTDCMKIHQSGYPNVVAALGAGLSSQQKSKLSKYFDKIICFGDADSAGEQMNCAIIEACRDAELSVVEYPEDYPNDPGGMDSDQIKECIESAENIYTNLFK